MAAAPGKNKVEKSLTLIWGGQNLEGDLLRGSLNIGDEFESVDMTGVSEELINYLAGHRNADVTARFHMNDTATTGATTVLNTSYGSTSTLTMAWGGAGAAPDTGDPELEGVMVHTRLSLAVDSGKFVHDVQFLPTGSAGFTWGTAA